MFVGPRNKATAPASPAVYVSLTEGDYLSVAELAERDGLSLAAFVRMLVRRHIESAKRSIR